MGWSTRLIASRMLAPLLNAGQAEIRAAGAEYVLSDLTDTAAVVALVGGE